MMVCGDRGRKLYQALVFVNGKSRISLLFIQLDQIRYRRHWWIIDDIFDLCAISHQKSISGTNLDHVLRENICPIWRSAEFYMIANRWMSILTACDDEVCTTSKLKLFHRMAIDFRKKNQLPDSTHSMYLRVCLCVWPTVCQLNQNS